MKAMGRVNVLDKHTAELIAAGEVVERPASVVKELVENSIDAGAKAVTVELRSGGVRYIRITDDGEGIEHEDVPKAFLRHATSKIAKGEDLNSIATLGFRGEALASVAAVAKVELITSTSSDRPGTHYVIEGGEEKDYSECGCARGTTIVVRDLFYNTPARLKFLKTDVKEGVAVASLLDRLALSHPEVAFRLVREGKQTLVTPGDGKLESAVYAVFGREFYQGLIPVKHSFGNVSVEGFISKPTESRPNTIMQTFFINGRYCRSKTMQAALEAAYKGSIMVGRRPACVLYVSMDCSAVDVNVHPAKLEVRFTNEKPIFDSVYGAVKNALNACTDRRQIQLGTKNPDPSIYAPPQPAPPVQTTVAQAVKQNITQPAARPSASVGGTQSRIDIDTRAAVPVQSEPRSASGMVMRDPGLGVTRPVHSVPPVKRPIGNIDISADELPDDRPAPAAEIITDDGRGFPEKDSAPVISDDARPAQVIAESESVVSDDGSVSVSASVLIEDRPADERDRGEELSAVPADAELSAPSAAEKLPPDGKDYPASADGEGFLPADAEGMSDGAPADEAVPVSADDEQEDLPPMRIVGEAFDTYILLESGDELVVIDKHAAHERLIYEQLRRNMPGGSAQMLLEPVAVTLDKLHCQALTDNAPLLEKAGFEIEEFGTGTVLVRSAPMMIATGDIAQAVAEIAGNLSSGKRDALMTERMDHALHTIACRAAIKGGDRSRPQELAALVAKLMANPDVRYCPHGRPIYTVLTRRELEKSFGRIQ